MKRKEKTFFMQMKMSSLDSMKQYVVVGLGVFGTFVARELAASSNEVVCIDTNETLVNKVSDTVTKAIIGDTTDKAFLEELDIANFDCAIVGIGDHLENAILTIMNLKELGVKHIVAKAKSKEFEEVLKKVGADQVVRPEKDSGQRLAKSLITSHIKDFIDIDDEFSLVEMVVPKEWVGKNLKELNLRNKYDVNVIGRREYSGGKMIMRLDPDEILKENEIFCLIASNDSISKLDKKLK